MPKFDNAHDALMNTKRWYGHGNGKADSSHPMWVNALAIKDDDERYAQASMTTNDEDAYRCDQIIASLKLANNAFGHILFGVYVIGNGSITKNDRRLQRHLKRVGCMVRFEEQYSYYESAMHYFWLKYKAIK